MATNEVSQHLSETYSEYYQEGTSEWRMLGAQGKASNIVDLCQDLPIESVLEIGAGEGAVLHTLSDRGFGQDLFALEISPSGVEQIQNRGIARLREAKLYKGYDVPYADDSFDLAILSHVIEHVEHPRILLCEAKRIAKYVFIEVPLEDNAGLSWDFEPDSVGHINFYSPKTIRSLVQTCGFRVLDQMTVNAPKSVYTFGGGSSGLLKYYIKEAALRLVPSVATRRFTYASAMVCTAI